MAKPLGREREFVVQVRFTVNLVELRKACRRLVARLSDESEIGTDFAVFQATGIAQGGATHSFVCPQPLESAPLLRFFARGETRFCICNAWATPPTSPAEPKSIGESHDRDRDQDIGPPIENKMLPAGCHFTKRGLLQAKERNSFRNTWGRCT